MDNLQKYRNILGVPINANKDDIKKAYKQKALSCHPDKTGGSDNEFVKISEAYNKLLAAKNVIRPNQNTIFKFNTSFTQKNNGSTLIQDYITINNGYKIVKRVTSDLNTGARSETTFNYIGR